MKFISFAFFFKSKNVKFTRYFRFFVSNPNTKWSESSGLSDSVRLTLTQFDIPQIPILYNTKQLINFFGDSPNIDHASFKPLQVIKKTLA